MSSRMRFQFPAARAGFLLETLLEACDGAESGGSVFAWCNRGGIEGLLHDSVFKEFFKRGGSYRLIVGVDSITDEDALIELKSLADLHGGFRPGVLLHAQSGSMFHPKFSWFTSGDDLKTVVGSGNMTLGGLRKNWEVSVFSEFNGVEAASQLGDIESYLTQLDPYVVPVDHPAALARARKNSSAHKAARRAITRQARTAAQGVGADQFVLLAEITKSDNRWQQANFTKAIFESFFGAQVSRQSRIILRHVSAGGSIGAVESRPSVAVKSQNYRFELAAGKGLPYPSAGRPIGVFLRLSQANFFYQLLMPEDSNYSDVLSFMKANWDGPSNQLMRIIIERPTVQSSLANLPLWNAADAESMDETS